MNTRRKKILTVLAVGSLILVWRVYSLIEKYGPSAAVATDVSASAAAQPVTPHESGPSKSLKQLLERQNEVARQGWGRNPFADVAWVVRSQKPVANAEPKSEQAPPAPEMQFIGTSKSNDQWMAAVHGEIHRVGDTVLEKFRIVRITRRTLTLESDGWTYTYQIGTPGATVAPFTEESK